MRYERQRSKTAVSKLCSELKDENYNIGRYTDAKGNPTPHFGFAGTLLCFSVLAHAHKVIDA
tara:strand:- start:115 stop:300 length:186 start_codon:yes stop_codon:yes gene_type:complete